MRREGPAFGRCRALPPLNLAHGAMGRSEPGRQDARKEVKQKMDISLPQEKACGRCRAIKPLDEFGPMRRNADGREYRCRQCNAEVARERYARKNGKALLPPPARRPLPDFARDAGQRLQKDAERLERIFADNRFASNRDQMATRLRGHLKYTAEVCQDLLSQLDQHTGG